MFAFFSSVKSKFITPDMSAALSKEFRLWESKTFEDDNSKRAISFIEYSSDRTKKISNYKYISSAVRDSHVQFQMDQPSSHFSVIVHCELPSKNKHKTIRIAFLLVFLKVKKPNDNVVVMRCVGPIINEEYPFMKIKLDVHVRMLHDGRDFPIGTEIDLQQLFLIVADKCNDRLVKFEKQQWMNRELVDENFNNIHPDINLASQSISVARYMDQALDFFKIQWNMEDLSFLCMVGSHFTVINRIQGLPNFPDCLECDFPNITHASDNLDDMDYDFYFDEELGKKETKKKEELLKMVRNVSDSNSSSFNFMKSLDIIEKSFSEKEYVELQHESAFRVFVETGISLSVAYVLLLNHESDDSINLKSNPEKLISIYKGSPEEMNKLLQKLNLKLHTRFQILSGKTSKTPIHCAICFTSSDDDSQTMFGSLGCHVEHIFCIDCWRTFIEHALDSNDQILTLRCPGQSTAPNGSTKSCSELCGYEVFDALVAGEEMFARYERLLMAKQALLFKCPGANCQMYLPKSNRYEVIKRYLNGYEYNSDGDIVEYGTCRCKCGSLTCVSCEINFHRPLNCEELTRWNSLCDEYRDKQQQKAEGSVVLAASAERLEVKACPNPDCNTPTHRSTGCMHLICSRCKVEWCWQCGNYGGGTTGRPQPHHVFVCNDPKNANWGKVSVDFDDDGHFVFYHDRFRNHLASQQLAIKNKLRAAELLNQLKSFHELNDENLKTYNDSVAVNLVQKLVCEAFELLICCRGVLANSYAYAYLINKELPKELFKHLQAEFEHQVELMSQTVEEASAEVLFKNYFLIDAQAKALTSVLSNVANYES